MAQVQLPAKKITFYYFPTSFSSQKVLFALYEKDIKFKPKLVRLFAGQHNEPWYVKMNPDGNHVPVLKVGADFIVDPSEIIDYISSIADGAGHPLVPARNSELGKNVQEICLQLDSIPVDIITYGIIFHPHLSVSGCQIPRAVQRSMKENFTKRLRLLADLATKLPDLRDVYLSKSQLAAQNYDIISDEDQVKKWLESVEPFITCIEEQLKTIREGGSDISDELWLFGPMFTVADISLSALLTRINLLGLSDRYIPADRCPCIHHYYRQIQKRPAYKAVQKEISHLQLTLIVEDVKAVSPYIFTVLCVGAMLGAGYYVYKKLIEK